MTALDRYMTAIAIKKSDEQHIPRIQEIVRVMSHALSHISRIDPDEDIELCAEIANEALGAIAKSEDIALDGLLELGYEQIEDKSL